MSVASPPPPPPPVPCLNLNKSSSNKDGRNLLLESIRQGKSLRKTTTNDRSTPVIPGTNTNSQLSNNNHITSTNNGSGNAITQAQTNLANKLSAEVFQPHAGLGGLFANGIPKLKPTGLPIGQAYQQSRNENEGGKNEDTCRKSNNSNQNRNLFDSTRTKLDTRNRGPPPQPPLNSQKCINTNNGSETSQMPTPVHSRMGSTASLNENSYPCYTLSHGKPNLAPKPAGYSTINNNSLNTGRSLVTRAQSMRVPRSSLPVTTDSNDGTSQFSSEVNKSELYRIQKKNNPPSFYQSQDSLNRRINKAPSPPTWGQSATLRHNSRGSPIRPPLTKPPPPPTRVALNPPMCPPPPPPTICVPPPPPPHRTTSVGHAPLPPPPPSILSYNKTNLINTNNTPPRPPIRNSSMRHSGSINKTNHDVISRCLSMFHKAEEFPGPQPYKNVLKIYNSRVQAKQQAPPPPPPVPVQFSNKIWQSEETSNC